MITESRITLRDGAELFRYDSRAENEKAHLLFVHGYAEHSKRYVEFAQALNQKNISFTSYDHRGHGQSSGLMAYIRRFSDLIQDLDEVAEILDTKSPTFIMGHSMGGLVGLNHLLQTKRTYSGFICSSAALEIDPDMSPILQKLAPVMGFLFPKLPTQPLDTTYLTRSPDNHRRYFSDPLIYTKGMRARTAAEMIKTIKKTRTRFHEFTRPFLVLHGESDRLTMPSGSVKFHGDASSEDKSIRTYPGLYHELVFEPEKDEIIKDIIDWILSRVD